MTFMDDPSGNIKAMLTVRRVNAGYVFGLMEIYPYAGPTVTRHFRGTLKGNELWIGRWKLTVFPRRMTGHSYGSRLTRHGGAEIDLMKH